MLFVTGGLGTTDGGLLPSVDHKSSKAETFCESS